MLTPISDLSQLLRSINPQLHDGVFVYSSIPEHNRLDGFTVVATVREPEGLSIILPEAEAQAAHLPCLFRCAWITLTVYSDLQAVGLTAAIAGALGNAGISCNVVAGAYHDHLFVPVERAEAALQTLRELQSAAAG